MLTKVIGWILVATLPLFVIEARCEEPAPAADSIDWIKVTSKVSLAHLGGIDSFGVTENGKQAAKFLLAYLQQRTQSEDLGAIRMALSTYERIIPRENYGGEYTTLQWFSEYFLASEDEKQRLLADKYVRSFFEYMSANDFAALKEYIQHKYKLTDEPRTEQTQKREAFLENLILFDNPKREQWEKTRNIVDTLNLKKGDRIADVGSGPGYYTFKFAELVGDEGRVFAIETDKNLLGYVQNVAAKYHIPNVELVQVQSNGIGLPKDSVNIVFMCSLYHVIYLTEKEKEKDEFVTSIKEALKQDGSLVIVDNALVKESELPYHGPYIAKELIIAQLKYYGFRLVAQYAFIPQRYVLVFKKA